MNKEQQLKLENQICFPIYSVSRLVTKAYKPHLEKLGLTYPQYLVLLVLWENDNQSVNKIGRKSLKIFADSILYSRIKGKSIV